MMECCVTEVVIANRPGGREVGPIRAIQRSSACVKDVITVEASKVHDEPALDKTEKIPNGTVVFSIDKVVTNGESVLFYHFYGSSAEDPTNKIRIAKRYSEFKMLHTKMSALVVNKRKNGSASQQPLFDTSLPLPKMPTVNVWTLLRGRYNNKTIEEREKQFTKILNAISRHPVACQISIVFPLMGCKNSKNATLTHRASTVATPLRPSTPSFHAQNSKLGIPFSGSQTNEIREEPPSFVVSNSADLVGSSDCEPVHGMVSAFTFSFIQASETNSNRSSLGDVFKSDELAPRGQPESLTFALTSDSIELTPITEVLRDTAKKLTSTTVNPLQDESDVVEPEVEPLPPLYATHADEIGALSESALTESSDLLVSELLDASDSSHNSSTFQNRRILAASKMSKDSEFVVMATGQVVRQESLAQAVSEAVTKEIERESIETIVAAIVQNVIDTAVSNTTRSLVKGKGHQTRERGNLVASRNHRAESSTMVSRAKVDELEILSGLNVCVPVYAVVDTSTDNGVVMYHVQLMDETTGCAKWPTPMLHRYSNFSDMYSKLKETKLPATDELPNLPPAGIKHLIRGRQSKKTVRERQLQFSDILFYISKHQTLHDSAIFQSFLAT
ncbi:hypothetical protein PsorP6_005964 [Peronosclerospora sorghi]|uniref:Uncharacterized protein n=1 Tax=Peronosclerospora sorghi TaxID=230839 RepID=A0ACC0W7P2_9STRA|nr:hypothetical protein PsorP6_005964 [Peronosclerospora sorghi]